MAWSLEKAMKRREVLKEGHFLLSSGSPQRPVYAMCTAFDASG